MLSYPSGDFGQVRGWWLRYTILHIPVSCSLFGPPWLHSDAQFSVFSPSLWLWSKLKILQINCSRPRRLCLIWNLFTGFKLNSGSGHREAGTGRDFRVGCQVSILSVVVVARLFFFTILLFPGCKSYELTLFYSNFNYPYWKSDKSEYWMSLISRLGLSYTMRRVLVKARPTLKHNYNRYI